tara:strand:- start:67 stop:606 length:540 start_codon:yes stop_codon:yes gene_type:complete
MLIGYSNYDNFDSNSFQFDKQYQLVYNTLTGEAQEIETFEGYNISRDLQLLEGNISQNPLFENEENNDFSLQLSSPCIDSGIAFYSFENEILVDINFSEYIGSAPDMGAFESCLANVGDLTDDCEINIFDVIVLIEMVINIVNNNYIPLDSEIQYFDISSDGIINVVDIVVLVNIILEQ